MTSQDYVALIFDQIEFYWGSYLRPKLDGLTDTEYFWEPVPGCWSIRPDAQGLFQIEQSDPEPEPPPVTTIAWRMMHIADNLYFRKSAFFGDPTIARDVSMFDSRFRPEGVPETAAEGVSFLDRCFHEWLEALKRAPLAHLEAPMGPRGDFFRDSPLIALVMHTNRELMHHGGEILLLRDLYRAEFRG